MSLKELGFSSNDSVSSFLIFKFIGNNSCTFLLKILICK